MDEVQGVADLNSYSLVEADSYFNTFPLDVQPKPDDNIDIRGKIESKFMSIWNNVKFNVKIGTNFSKESPVWLLGRCYHRKTAYTESLDNTTEIATEATSQQILDQIDSEGIDGFKLDFSSKLWLTYRRNFPLMPGSTFTTDCGWGCMLRSGQMLLAQALVCHFLGRSWRWAPEQGILTKKDFQDDCCHRKIIKWFGDKPSANSPLSIHQMVKLGENLGKKPGDWYGPASVAHCLKTVIQAASKENYEFDELTVYVAQDSTIYIKDIYTLCKINNSWKSLILLVPVKLGVDKLNPIYAPCLSALLTLEHCIGIIGGRPKHSLYFVGFQDDRLIHLDPHYCQDTVDVWQANFPLSTYHCKSPRKMAVSKMDPSCCIGFYIRTESQFESFVTNLKILLKPQTNASNTDYQIFTINEEIHYGANEASIRYSLLESERNWVLPCFDDYETDNVTEEFVLM